MSSTPGVVIAGAGHAGSSVAAHLRQYGWKGPICVVGEDAEFPYDRPPLSKAYLKGEVSRESLALRLESFYAAHDISIMRSTCITAIDSINRRVALSSGSTLPYQYLVIATGSKHRRLNIPGIDLPQVLELRTLADADKLKLRLKTGKRVGIIGGGYVGLEVAACVWAAGSRAIVVERENRVLARVASQELATFVHAYHCRQGTQVVLNAQATAIEAQHGAVSGIRLHDGTFLPCETVLVGIGAIANDELARSAGLACNDGVMVNDGARTSDPYIFAIGDCTRRPVPGYHGTVRLESIPSSQEQAKQAASSIMGRAATAPTVPWFWSNQFELRLQIAGLRQDIKRTFLRGDPASGSFAVFHLGANSQVQAVEAINSPAEFMVGKALIASGVSISADSEMLPVAALKQMYL
ncbi:MAG: FAD-dependent oxidoreductase [Polaromonas sp.]